MFLAVAHKSKGVNLERGEVYAAWLRDQLDPPAGASMPWHGAVDLLDVQLQQFRRLHVLRRTQRSDAGGERAAHAVEGPEAMLSGALRVRDSDAFSKLVARGVGRHRAFGFGMLLLRPAL